MSGEPGPDGPPEGASQEDRESRPELDVDAAFAAIVAGWNAPAPGLGPWPASEDLTADDASGDPGATPGDPTAATTAAQAVPPVLPDAWPGSGWQDGEDDDEEDFQPPDPLPASGGDVLSRLSWAGVIGGPLLLLVTVLFWQTAPEFVLLGALVAFVGGFVTLVARMPTERPDDDDGAVV